MKVVILRGVPGSGKSAYADRLRREAVKLDRMVQVVSADLSHMVGGKYRFDPAKKATAHNDCLNAALDEMQGGDANLLIIDNTNDANLLIIDNTNTTIYEIAPYYRLAEALGHDVEIVRIHCDFETAMRRNVHDVPRSTCWAMWQNLLTERLPSWWRETVVFSDEVES